ncbi:MAG: AMP-binding protein [Tenacibaculum sp.]
MLFDPEFKLNNRSFVNSTELLKYSEQLSEDTHCFFQSWFANKNYITVHTSGSTGKPRAIRLKKSHMINSAKATGAFFNLSEKSTSLLCLSAKYIAGKMMLVRALSLGWHLNIVQPKANPLKDLKNTYDFAAMIPLQLHNSLNDLHKIKKILVGGAEVLPSLKAEIQEVSTEIYASYGMTETLSHIALMRLNNFLPDKENKSVFTVLPGIKISQDKRNCLTVKAPNILDKEVITNDVVELVSEKEFNWLGRYDHVINSAGIKLHPEVIERKLATVLEQRFFVAGLPDSVFGKKLVLLVEGRGSETKIDEIHNKIAKTTSLAKYQQPKQIFFIDNFIEAANKKIDRKKTLSILKQL